MEFENVHGERIPVPYIRPSTWVKFLVSRHPELIFGGYDDLTKGEQNLESFWSCYEKVHATHELFVEPRNPVRSKANTIPLAFHGDEGRGAKKGNTCVMTIEAVLGTGDPTGRDFRCCRGDCSQRLCPSLRKKFGIHECAGCDDGFAPMCAQQVPNLKNNSFLTKFVVCVLPTKFYKDTCLLEKFMDLFCADIRELCHTGVQVPETGKHYFAGMVGFKGDLKWYQKIGSLKRCFSKQVVPGEKMCHECGAGTYQKPFEDFRDPPSWSDTLWEDRPWPDADTPALARVPFDASCPTPKPEMIMRRDLFHLSKVGILRDYVGSSVFLLIHLGYFREMPGPGVSNKKAACLDRAYYHFSWFCKTLGKSPGLHAFRLQFFNFKSERDYPWVSSKGSDTTLLVAWLRVLSQTTMATLIDEKHRPLFVTMHRAAVCIEGWQHIIYSHGLWLPRSCAAALYQQFDMFLECYNTLAYLCLNEWNFAGYSMKSKFHLLAHTKFELYVLLMDPSVEWFPNPEMFGCEQNEDVVGRLSRISRRVSPILPVTRTLDLYLMKCRAVHNRFRKVLKLTLKRKR